MLASPIIPGRLYRVCHQSQETTVKADHPCEAICISLEAYRMQCVQRALARKGDNAIERFRARYQEAARRLATKLLDTQGY